MSAFANHLWQSTAFAGVAALLTLALRRNRAHLRYWLWLAASVKFLIPFSALVAVGSLVEWRTASGVPGGYLGGHRASSRPVRLGFAGGPRRIYPMMEIRRQWPVAVWLCGCAFLLGRWFVRWRRVRSALRTASPVAAEAPVPVMCSDTRLEPGVFGVFRPILLVPEGLADRLTPRSSARSSPTNCAMCGGVTISPQRFTWWWKRSSGSIRWCGGSERGWWRSANALATKRCCGWAASPRSTPPEF